METIRAKAVQKIMGIDTTHFFVDNKNFYVRCENKESRENFEKYLKENLPQYTLWREEKGDRNWVLYRNDMFEVFGEACLHFKGGKEVELPINCSSCYKMFFDCELPEGFSLGDKFDTSNVTDMCYMFWYCKFPEEFSLGDKFDTSNVTNMNSMFSDCELPKGFSLGDKFDTRNVKDMGYMFCFCKLQSDFSFGDLFTIGNNTNIVGMFDRCEIPEGVVLPKMPSEKTVQSAIGF